MTQLLKGHYYRIKRVLKQPNQSAYRYKLLAMGLVPGAQLYVKRIAPLGDPIQFEINGSSISLRRRELDAFLQLENNHDNK